MALTREDREKMMKAAGYALQPLITAQQVLDWYAGLFKAQLGPKWIGQVLAAEHKRRATAAADRQRFLKKVADKALEREASWKYGDENLAKRGQPQSGHKGPWSRARKAMEEAAKDLDRQAAEGVTFDEGEGERAKG